MSSSLLPPKKQKGHHPARMMAPVFRAVFGSYIIRGPRATARTTGPTTKITGPTGMTAPARSMCGAHYTLRASSCQIDNLYRIIRGTNGRLGGVDGAGDWA